MNPDDFTDVRLHIENKIARVIIKRPDKLNAIRIQTYQELIAALRAADESRDCHIITLEGEGEHFTAGNDLADLVDGNPAEVMANVQGIFDTAASLKKVLIAVVEGVAVGIGTTILLHCDMVFASSSTRFRLPFANLGVCPEGASSVLLPQAIGQKAAREVLLTGRFFTAEEALNWGLINRITQPGKTNEEALQHIQLLLQQPLASLLATKALMRASTAEVNAVVKAELVEFSRLLESDETKSRIQALLSR